MRACARAATVTDEQMCAQSHFRQAAFTWDRLRLILNGIASCAAGRKTTPLQKVRGEMQEQPDSVLLFHSFSPRNRTDTLWQSAPHISNCHESCDWQLITPLVCLCFTCSDFCLQTNHIHFVFATLSHLSDHTQLCLHVSVLRLTWQFQFHTNLLEFRGGKEFHAEKVQGIHVLGCKNGRCSV